MALGLPLSSFLPFCCVSYTPFSSRRTLPPTLLPFLFSSSRISRSRILSPKLRLSHFSPHFVQCFFLYPSVLFSVLLSALMFRYSFPLPIDPSQRVIFLFSIFLLSFTYFTNALSFFRRFSSCCNLFSFLFLSFSLTCSSFFLFLFNVASGNVADIE